MDGIRNGRLRMDGRTDRANGVEWMIPHRLLAPDGAMTLSRYFLN